MKNTAIRIACSIIAAFATASIASAQPTLSKVFTPSTIGPGSVSTITFTITNNTGGAVTDLAFTDVLPTGPDVDIADPANASTTCLDGIVSAPDNGGTITFTDGRLGGAPNESCTVTVDVTAGTPDVYTNPAITLTSSAPGTSMSLPIDLTVVATLPGFSKSFSPSSIPLGDRSTLTFTFDNTLNASRVGNLEFADNLPAGMVVADPSNAVSDCISASNPDTIITAVPGTSIIDLDANGSTFFPGFEVLPDGATCTVSVDVTATGVGILDNISNDGLADFTSAGKASATLEVTRTDLALRKEFIDDPTPPGNSATLEFTIDNFDRIFSATGVAFTDNLSTVLAGLTFDSLLFNDCGGSVMGAGTSLITFSGGTIAPEASCTLRVTLSVPAGATPGAYTNTTSTISGMVDGSPVVGNMASDDLYVEPVPLLTMEFLEVGTFAPDPVVDPGDSVVIRYTITNTSTTSGATDITFQDELTNAGPGIGFFPFPLAISDPSIPAMTCGGNLGFFFPDIDRQGLTLTGGSLAAAPGPGETCTIDVTITVPDDMAPGIYTSTTGEISATVDSDTRVGNSASDTLTVIAAPSLTKSFDGPVAPGGTVTLEFTLENSPNSPTDATAITFTDDLTSLVPPIAGLTANVPPTPDPPCGAGSTLAASAGDTLLTLMGASLMPGEVCTFTVTLDVPMGTASGSYTNTTSGVAATVSGLPVTSLPASNDLEVGGLLFSKEFLGDPAYPGEVLTLRFNLENISAVAATDIGFTDSLFAVAGLEATDPALSDDCGGTLTVLTIPGTGSFLTYASGTLAAGSSCTIDVEVTVPLTADDGIYENFVSGVSYMLGAVPGFDGPAIDNLLVDSDQLSLFKAFTDDPVAPGDSVTLEFTLTNLDSGAATMVQFTDDFGAILPGVTFDSEDFNDCGAVLLGLNTDTLAVAGAFVPGNGTCTIRVSMTVPPGAAAGLYTNTSSSVGGEIGGAPVSGDPATDDLEIIQLLDFSKSFDGPTTATGQATLTFTITNPGPDLAIDIDFTDDLDAVIPGLIATSLPALPCGAGSSITGISFLTFSGGELPPMGGTCTFDVDVLVPVSATGGTFPNVTSVLFQSGLEVADPATADLTIEPAPTFAKVFAPDFIGFGLNSTLTFTIDNSASALAASALAFTDTLPAGLVVATPSITANTCGGTLTAVAGSGSITLAGGSVAAGATCTISVDVTGNAVGALVNTTGDLMSSSGNSGQATDTLTVNPQPAFSKSFAPNPAIIDELVALTFTIDNTGSTVAATLLDFTDNLPANVTVATPPSESTTCTGGTITAVAGSSVISYTGGTVAAGASCTINVDVVASAAGDHVNTSGNLSSSLGTSGTAIDTLTVNPPPGFTKVFAPDSIAVGETSTLTFTIDNSASTVGATALVFEDNLPTEVVIATPAGTTNSCGGTLTAASATTFIFFTGGTVAAGATCTITVDVTSSTPGAHVNLTEEMTSSLGNSGTATDTLTVNPQPGFSKSFAPNPTTLNQPVTLTFTIDNSASTVDATGLDFTDVLPADLLVATPPSASTTCTGGTVTAVAGTDTISYSGGTVSASSSCTVTVDVVASATGDLVNLSGDLTSSLGNSGPATDTLTVNPAPGFTKVFAPNPILVGGVSTLTFTIDNGSGTVDATGITFEDNLPTEMVIANPPATTNTCGGTLTADAGTGLILLTGASVTTAASCTVTVDITSSTGGTHVNVTEELTSSLGNSGTATDSLIVNPPPGFAKVFAPNPIVQGETSTLTFTIDNSVSTIDALSLDFTDNFPATLEVATPPSVSTDCVGGTLTAVGGTAVVSYSGGSLAAGAVCSISVDVIGDAPGSLINTTGDLTSTLGNSGPATDTLVVNPPPAFSKTFAPNIITTNSSSTLTFELDNSGSTEAATAVDFTDTFPAGMIVATPANASTTCVGGTLTAVPGSGSTSYTGGTIPALTVCSVAVEVTADAKGTYDNISGELTSSLGNSGTAAATLGVIDTGLEIEKAFLSAPNLPGGTVTVEYTISNNSNFFEANEITFDDDFDSALPGLVASVLATDPCGPGSSLSGASVLTLTSGLLAANTSCTFAVDLVVPVDAADGTYPSSTSLVSGEIQGFPIEGAPATDDLEVEYLGFEKFFDGQAEVGGTTFLTFSITNPDPINPATGITFEDDLDAVLPGLTALGLPQADVCGVGSSLEGSSVITLIDGALGGGESCEFSVEIKIPASATGGLYTNITSGLEAIVGGQTVAGGPASAASDELEVLFLPTEIPTLDTLGLLVLISLLGLFAVRRLGVRHLGS